LVVENSVQPLFSQLAAKDVLSPLDVLRMPLLLKPILDLIAGLVAATDAQPVERGRSILGSNDFHDVGVLQFIVEGHHFAIDLSAYATMADLGMHSVGKVDGYRARRQIDDVTAGGKNENLVGEEIDLEIIDVFLGIARIVLPIQDGPDPGIDLFE